ncbi:MAG: chemotaxis protein CheW [Acidimicrobiia bacterium]|nr:chemotaxis protein CheW [Acidimicrobiia bacterium]
MESENIQARGGQPEEGDAFQQLLTDLLTQWDEDHAQPVGAAQAGAADGSGEFEPAAEVEDTLASLAEAVYHTSLDEPQDPVCQETPPVDGSAIAGVVLETAETFAAEQEPVVEAAHESPAEEFTVPEETAEPDLWSAAISEYPASPPALPEWQTEDHAETGGCTIEPHQGFNFSLDAWLEEPTHQAHSGDHAGEETPAAEEEMSSAEETLQAGDPDAGLDFQAGQAGDQIADQAAEPFADSGLWEMLLAQSAEQEEAESEPEAVCQELDEELEPVAASEPEIEPQLEPTAISPPAPEAPAPARVRALSDKTEGLLELIRAMYGRIQERKSDVGVAGKDGYVVVKVGAGMFGLPMRRVMETDRLPRITPLPFVPDFVPGVANLRGEVLPLIDLRLLLGLEADSDGRMVVVRPKEGESPAALLVDGLGGIAWLGRSELTRVEPQQAPEQEDALQLEQLVSAVGQHRSRELGILDLERLFASKELTELRNV